MRNGRDIRPDYQASVLFLSEHREGALDVGWCIHGGRSHLHLD